MKFCYVLIELSGPTAQDDMEILGVYLNETAADYILNNLRNSGKYVYIEEVELHDS